MSDITSLAKRIILIGKGEVLYDGSFSKLKNTYETKKFIFIKTKDKLTIRKKGVKLVSKTKDGYNLELDTRFINISEALNIITDKIDVQDIEIDNESVDSLIVKLYEDFKIWEPILVTLNLGL